MQFQQPTPQRDSFLPTHQSKQRAIDDIFTPTRLVNEFTSDGTFSLSNKDLSLCIEFMKRGKGAMQSSEAAGAFRGMRKGVWNKKMDLIGHMESIRLDQQKVGYKKEELTDHIRSNMTRVKVHNPLIPDDAFSLSFSSLAYSHLVQVR